MVTVKMSVVDSPYGHYTVKAVHPVHGVKYLMTLTARYYHSKRQGYKSEAEQLMLVRCGSSRQFMQFSWDK